MGQMNGNSDTQSRFVVDNLNILQSFWWFVMNLVT